MCALDRNGKYRTDKIVCDWTVIETVGSIGDRDIKGNHCYVRVKGVRQPYKSDCSDCGYYSIEDPIECVVGNFEISAYTQTAGID